MASIEVINAKQANPEAPVEIQLSLGNPIYRGPVGPMGPAGPQGSPGFWVSETPPGEESNIEVWIDPNGEETPLVTTVNGQTGNVVVQSRHNEMSNSDILDIWENS